MSPRTSTGGMSLAFIFWVFVVEVLAQDSTLAPSTTRPAQIPIPSNCPTITSTAFGTSGCPPQATSRAICDVSSRVNVPCGCPSQVPSAWTTVCRTAGQLSCGTFWYITTTSNCGSPVTTVPTTTKSTSTLLCPTITSTVFGGCQSPTPQTTAATRIICDVFSTTTIPCGCPTIVPRVYTTVCPTPGQKSCGTSWRISTTACAFSPTPTATTTTRSVDPCSLTRPAVIPLPKWSQCGGKAWIGMTTCACTDKCVYINEWYSQCQ